MDLHNRLLILLFLNVYIKFRVVRGWLQESLGGFEWFAVLVVTIFYLRFRNVILQLLNPQNL